MAVVIREFTLADYDAALALWSASEGVGLSEADEPRNVARFLERNPGLSFVAVEETSAPNPPGTSARIVGAVLCGNDGRRGFLHHLAVDKEHRRAGVGRQLVERCLQALSAAGMRKCHIFVLADNVEGQRFWRSIGWDERTTLKVMSHDVYESAGYVGAESAGYVGAESGGDGDASPREPRPTIEEVIENLATLGIAHEVRPSGADGAILLLPEYGRVLGIWPHGRAENVLWVSRDFFQSLRVGAKDDRWNNPGGDRVWLAPASEFLGEGGVVPPAIDPGKYVLSFDRGSACMTNIGEAWAYGSSVRVRFRLTRRLRALDDAALETAWGPTFLRRAGCEEEIELQILGACPVPVRLWNIAQVPPGSEITERTAAGGRTVLCLEDADSDHARLLVRSSPASSRETTEAGVWAGRVRSPGAPMDLVFLSAAAERGAKRRVTLRTSTCGFSGRSAEVRRFATSML